MQKHSFLDISLSACNRCCTRAYMLNENTTFGSPLIGRSYTADTLNGYRFGFNKQEKDDEIYGKGNASSAEFWEYDTRLGRRWNVDPILNMSIGSYCAYSNSPLVFIDPEGNTDYFNSAGVWIGTNGKTDGLNAIVTDYKIVKELKKYSKKGQDYVKEIPNEKFNVLPSDQVIRAAILTFDISQYQTKEDPEGGKHEAATYFKSNMDQSPILVGTETIDANDAEKHFKGQEINTDGPTAPKGYETGAVSIHSHPTGTAKYQAAVNLFHHIDGDAADPSEADETTFGNYDLNIIVGKTGKYKESSYTIWENGVSIEKTEPIYRPDQAHFYDKNSKHLYSANIDALRKINSGDGKSESKSFKKYNENKN